MSLIYILSNSMVAFILVVAVIEAMLYITLFGMAASQTHHLYRSLRSMMKGIRKLPVLGQRRTIHDEISVLLDTAEILKRAQAPNYRKLLLNIGVQDSRKIELKTYNLERWSNVANAIVQAFPLLGIFGTILALGQSMQSTGADISGIMKAFTNAIDTTMLGLAFAVIYMLVDAFFQAKSARLRQETDKYRDVMRYFHEV